MDSKQLLPKNDDELEKIWIDGFQKWMDDARNSENRDTEFENQQEVYTKFAKLYDKAIELERYSGPSRIASKINTLFGNDKDIDILDFGCGTGLVSDVLFDYGFHKVDGLDSNKEMIDIASSKKRTRKLLHCRGTDGIQSISDNFYDIVCSAGVFFLSSSHPGTECFKDLCRVIKRDGFLIILTKNAYLSQSYVHFDVIQELEKEGILKLVEKETFEGYRQAFEFEEDPKSMGVILSYQVL